MKNTERQARAMRENGASVAAIAAALGVSERTVYRWVGPKQEQETDYLMSEILFLRSQGEHPVMIAEMLHRDRESLLVMANRHHRADVAAALTLDRYTEQLWRGTAWADVPGVGRSRAS